MVQLDSIPQQIVNFYQNQATDEEAYFRGVGNIEGVASTIVLALTDFAIDLNGFLDGTIVFNGQIRNPVELQNFNGDITQTNTGFVRLQDGFPGTLVQLDFNDNELALTINPFREPAPTYNFSYEATTQDYVLGYLSLPANFDAAEYGASNPNLSNRSDLDLNDYIEDFLFGQTTEPTNPPNNEPNEVLNAPIYRFQNSDRLGTYLFATAAESSNIRRDFTNFQEEGIAFNVATEAGDDLIRINRFQNRDVPGTYLFATEEESTSIRSNFTNFQEEGIAFYVYGADANKGNDFYRFQNTNQPGTYIFVNQEERDSIVSNFPQFELEGVAFEVG